jgi:hypothetical protein
MISGAFRSRAIGMRLPVRYPIAVKPGRALLRAAGGDIVPAIPRASREELA